MAQAKREPNDFERLIAALRAFADPVRAAQEKRYQKSSWEHWGVALPKMDAAIRATVADLGQRDSLALAARLWREPVWDLKIVAGRILARKAVAPDAAVWAFVFARMGDSTAGRSPTISPASAGAVCSLTRRGSTPSRLGDKRAFVDSPRRAGLHPGVDQGPARSRAHARLGGAAQRRSRMVHPEGDRLVAARTLQARPSTRAPILDEHGAPLMAIARREATKYLAAPPCRSKRA